MKKLTLYMVLFLLSCAVASSNSTAQEQKDEKNQKKEKTTFELRRYPIDKIYILYEIISDMFTGTEELFVADGGLLEAKYTTMKYGGEKFKMPGMPQEMKTATFLEGTSVYTVDFNQNTCTKTENEMLKALEGKDVEDLGKQVIIDMGGKKVKLDTLLNKPCEVWEIENLGTTSWFWNWIPLKTVTSMMGLKTTYKAKEIKYTYDMKMLNRPEMECDEKKDVMKEFKDIQKLYQQD